MTLDNPNILNDVLLTHTVTSPYHQLSSPLTPVVKTLLASFDGFNNSGIGAPTRTTSTLTPTTLRNIEQSFFDLSEQDDNTNSLPFQAGFVPPAPTYHTTTSSINNPLTLNNNSILTDDNSMDSSSMSSSSWHTTPPLQMTSDDYIESAKYSHVVRNNNNNNNVSNNKNAAGKAPRRNMGGRRPARPSNLSPEEEEKRRIRRERNKLAAARCRRRREDHTNELVCEVEGLESVKRGLQQDLQKLQREKEELEFLLQSHRPTCKRQIRDTPLPPIVVPTIKSEPVDDVYESDIKPPPSKRILLSNTVYNTNPIITPVTTMDHPQQQQQLQLPQIQTVQQQQRPARPNTLNVPMTLQPSQALNTVPIDTPTNGINNFNFDSLMEGGTGLTPINHPLRVITDSRNNLDLITPTSDASRLCSL